MLSIVEGGHLHIEVDPINDSLDLPFKLGGVIGEICTGEPDLTIADDGTLIIDIDLPDGTQEEGILEIIAAAQEEAVAPTVFDDAESFYGGIDS